MRSMPHQVGGSPPTRSEPHLQRLGRGPHPLRSRPHHFVEVYELADLDGQSENHHKRAESIDESRGPGCWLARRARAPDFGPSWMSGSSMFPHPLAPPHSDHGTRPGGGRAQIRGTYGNEPSPRQPGTRGLSAPPMHRTPTRYRLSNQSPPTIHHEVSI